MTSIYNTRAGVLWWPTLKISQGTDLFMLFITYIEICCYQQYKNSTRLWVWRMFYNTTVCLYVSAFRSRAEVFKKNVDDYISARDIHISMLTR